MNTLAIETGIEPEYENALIQSAKDIGWAIELVRHVPFAHVFEGASQALLQNPNVWFHGDITACKSAQAETAWQVHAPWEALRCTNYYDILYDRILNQDWSLTSIRGMKEDQAWLYEKSGMAEDDTLLFRPDGNDKVFSGTLVSRPDFDQAYKLVTFFDPDPEEAVIAARPQVIKAEARFLVVGGKLITGSYYRTGGQVVRLEAPPSLMAIGQEMLMFCLAKGYDPAPSWVLDLAETPEGWRIIEVGASSCCGLYKCDTDAFMRALDALPSPM
jgi:hypothetical protein